ncbi:TonB-dependent receptor [Novosphingobium flavum]|uniref:TonB-dependent receptor n=1 Tax=Novosphingobium flavum TaxID=1778672 RepID=A0A7X1FVJ2_9SPHN|nr:TonB-dependent receptor [Novosphingobium flavum]MBC2667162.1 TonB-dependent receptor [Novosphingobium flavum]
MTALFLGSAAAALSVPGHAQAQTAPAEATDGADSQDVIVVTGTRDPSQTVRNSISPISVVSGDALRSTGKADLQDALVQLSPSITRPRISNGAGNLVEKINLRTLSSNQTLILVNGKRRHTTAVVADTPGIENGSSPVDLGMIPTSAIDHVEILLDGAAAIYGSDAIAGVINIILKSNSEGGEFNAQNGLYYRGDGFSSSESVNYGMKLGAGGFVSLSAEYRHQDHTNRSETDTRVGKDVSRYFGMPASDRITLGLNAGYDLSSDIHAYAFGTFGHRYGESYQNYRLPSQAPALIPNGLNPLVKDLEDDFSITAGIKGEMGDWAWDISSTYGGDWNNYTLQDSMNQSLYKATGSTPFYFYVAGYATKQWTTDASLRRNFDLGLAAPLSITVGGQYRKDWYRTTAGDPNSYYGAGTDGVSGLSPSNAVSASRTVKAAYVDVSTKPLRDLQVALSGRYEDYTISGNVLTGKASLRYDFSPVFAVRGTVSNGFRAPSMGEQYFTKVGVTSLGASGTLGYSTPGGKLLGAPALKPEKSMNYSASLLINPSSRLHFAVDAYEITIRNRIVNAGTVSGATAIAALAAQGIQVNAGSTAVTVSYFTNAADTKTRGLDFTGSYHLPLGSGNSIDFSVAANFNHTDVLKVYNNLLGSPLLNTQTAAYISTYFPKNKFVFGMNAKLGQFGINLQEIRWGPSWTQRQFYSGPNANSITVFYPFHNDVRWQTNLELSANPTDRIRVALGANNLFNAYPNRAPAETVFAGVANYEQVGQGLDVQGGSYYASVRVKF